MEIYDRIYRNVKALAQMNGVNLGDVEKAIGRNPGFLSRHPKISIDQLITMAKFLDVHVNDLMEGNYEHELEVQTAMSSLDKAVWKAREYYNDEGVVRYVENALRRIPE